jgi:hypothetical protein
MMKAFPFYEVVGQLATMDLVVKGAYKARFSSLNTGRAEVQRG